MDLQEKTKISKIDNSFEVQTTYPRRDKAHKDMTMD